LGRSDREYSRRERAGLASSTSIEARHSNRSDREGEKQSKKKGSASLAQGRRLSAPRRHRSIEGVVLRRFAFSERGRSPAQAWLAHDASSAIAIVGRPIWLLTHVSRSPSAQPRLARPQTNSVAERLAPPAAGFSFQLCCCAQDREQL
jgi:hypothetical protein